MYTPFKKKPVVENLHTHKLSLYFFLLLSPTIWHSSILHISLTYCHFLNYLVSNIYKLTLNREISNMIKN